MHAVNVVFNEIANKEMIKNGNGIISIPIENITEFNELLSRYYTYNETEKLVDFIYTKAISGINY